MDFKNTSAEDLFSSSLHAFRNSLPPEERAEFQQFSTAEEMLGELRLHYSSRKNKRIEKSCRSVAVFAERLKPYFDVVGAFVQTNPEYVGWFWGATLLVCKLGTNYVGFFEKTSEMLEQIANRLPQYQEYIVLFNKRKDIPHERVVKILALVYADIIGFCQQIYTILVGRRTGPKWFRRVAQVGEVMWTPFNTRFGQLLERMARHEELFRQEARLMEGKMVDKLQRSMDFHYRRLHDVLSKSWVKKDEATEGEVSKTRKKQIEHHVQSIKAWIGTTDYESIHQHAKRRRRDGSCQWFLSLEQYTTWRDKAFDDRSQNVNAPGTLADVRLVRAKPGFGKTFLSTAIIEDLQAAQSIPNTTSEKSQNVVPAVAYFHFTREPNISSNETTIQAFRALVTQLVHSQREDPDIIDALSVLRWEGGSGQPEASYEEVLEALGYLLRHPTYLVVDGVDECRDYSLLLTALAQLCLSSSCRLILLGRPDILLPRPFTKLPCLAIDLTSKDNYSDILAMITTEFENLWDQGKFGNRPVSMDSAERTSRHANGMFLWARLFLSYLDSPALTPKKRHSFVIDAINFEGLNGLIIAILMRLDAWTSAEKTVVLNIFRWVAASLYPLTAASLHTALAITPGEETTDLDYLSDFPGCLPHLTGALVEIDAFGRPAFMHLSVKEFLTSTDPRVPISLSLAKGAVVHDTLASCCLSYLTHDIPRRPIRPLIPGCTKRDERTANERTSQGHSISLVDQMDYEEERKATRPVSDAHTRPPSRSPPDAHSGLKRSWDQYNTPQVSLMDVDNPPTPLNSPLPALSTTMHQPMYQPAMSQHKQPFVGFASPYPTLPAQSTPIHQPGYQAAMLQHEQPTLRPASLNPAMPAYLPPLDQPWYPAAMLQPQQPFLGAAPLNQPMSALSAPTNHSWYERAMLQRAMLQHQQPSLGATYFTPPLPAASPPPPQSWYQSATLRPEKPPFEAASPQSFTDEISGRASTPVASESAPTDKVAEQQLPDQEEDSLQRFPFIRYATLCWAQHLWMSLPSKHRNRQENAQVLRTDAFRPSGRIGGDDQRRAESVRHFPVWIPHLSRFLLCRAAVTNWTESSFHYHMTPTLKRLTDSLRSLGQEFSETTPESREVHWIVHGLNQLSEALDELAREHKLTLQKNPSLLWQRDITTATDPCFWPVWSAENTPSLGRLPPFHWVGEPFDSTQPVDDCPLFDVRA